MLQLQDICKSYKTGNLIQNALEKVNLTLRDNEFVAILGPSGSGKTTLLNIIGGLDHYDSGDLIIDGVSTKRFSDRDWDSYRNHSIGFVFQSYNLIPHQTILANVELALTIAGVGRSERKRRATEALEKVGLADQLHKLPEQLSGGQMQRVAIARALVNDPHILLADEPTGALDSETSIQVMELLREVAKDRLVVMVTHNPELANSYATRIISLRDGNITSDSYPVNDPSLIPPSSAKKHLDRISMSFLTALFLSFNNLKTKKARTFLVSFAGSIGIIGIALILAASAGVNEYIAAEQAAMLYAYPIEILNTSFDMTSFFSISSSGSGDSEDIGVEETTTRLFSNVGANDLSALREYFESGESDIYDYVNAIEYEYDIEPQIFLFNDGEYRQVNPNSILSSIDTGIFSASASPVSSLFSNDVFFQLPENENIYIDDYELEAGRWPESYNECVLLLNSNGNISDITLYALGLRDSLELQDMVEQFLSGETVDMPDDFGTYDYDDILGIEYKLVYATDYYEYDEENEIWVSRADDDDYIQELAENGETLEIVGIVSASSEYSSSLLTTGIYYTSMLTEHIIENAAETDIVQSQLENPDIDVFSGEAFDSEGDESEDSLESLFGIDSDALSEAFEIDEQSIEDSLSDSADMSQYFDIDSDSLDLSALVDLGDISLSLPSGMEEISLSDILDNIQVSASSDGINAIASTLMEGFVKYAAQDSSTDISRFVGGFEDYLQSEDAQRILTENINEIINAGGGIQISSGQIEELNLALIQGFYEYITINGYTDNLTVEIFSEYLNSETAQNIFNNWADDNLTISSDITVSSAQLQNLVSDLSEGYASYAESKSLPTAESIGNAFLSYLETEEAQSIISEGLIAALDTQSIEEQLSLAIGNYISSIASTYGDALQSRIEELASSAMTQLSSQLLSGMEEAMSGIADSISDSLSDAFDIDGDTLLNALGLDMSATELYNLLSSLSSDSSSYSDNLSSLGYADINEPTAIDIYPIDFDSKEIVIDILDAYNAQMIEEGNDDLVISYSDTTATLMSSVTDMINIISSVMIGVVAISLIVSSIMIGVITYISVLERKKEIGVLRALGASKRNISEVFNAETVIIGLCSGLLGVLIAYLLTIPLNRLIQTYLELSALRVFLPVLYAVALVAISVALTLFSGIIPSSRAAKSDPVDALRTE